MLAGHARVGDHQVAIHLAAHGVGGVIQLQRLLIIPLYEDRDGKDGGYARMRRRRHAACILLAPSSQPLTRAPKHSTTCPALPAQQKSSDNNGTASGQPLPDRKNVVYGKRLN